jgi:hypothetical protein
LITSFFCFEYLYSNSFTVSAKTSICAMVLKGEGLTRIAPDDGVPKVACAKAAQ